MWARRIAGSAIRPTVKIFYVHRVRKPHSLRMYTPIYVLPTQHQPGDLNLRHVDDPVKSTSAHIHSVIAYVAHGEGTLLAAVGLAIGRATPGSGKCAASRTRSTPPCTIMY